MRRRKHKNTRRAMRFYRITHGFREPYKVLVDGNFMHAVLEAKMKPVEESVPALLGAGCRLFTTQCVQQELRSMGQEYRDTLRTCKKLHLHKCEHEGAALPAADCLLHLVGESNSQHFLVASQDRALRLALLKRPGGAVINVAPDGLHLAQPSELQERRAAQADAQAGRVGSHEDAALRSLARGGAKQQQGSGGGRGGMVNDSKFVARRTKGANPLSCLPKKRKPQQQEKGEDGAADAEPGGKHKRPRRKRVKAAAAGVD